MAVELSSAFQLLDNGFWDGKCSSRAALTSDLGVGWTRRARPGARRTQRGVCILQVRERDDKLKRFPPPSPLGLLDLITVMGVGSRESRWRCRWIEMTWALVACPPTANAETRSSSSATSEPPGNSPSIINRAAQPTSISFIECSIITPRRSPGSPTPHIQAQQHVSSQARRRAGGAEP